MEAAFRFLEANPYLLLFLVVGLAVSMGRVTIKGYGLGMVASAIVSGAAVATTASLYGVTLQLDAFTKSFFYYLFIYGVGLRVGPSFLNSLKGDGARFAFLAVFCSVLGLAGAVVLARVFELPPGAAGGILAGAMTMSAAIGSAEQAVTSGAYALPPGVTAEQVSSMIALSYGVTYIWGTVGIILICKCLPRWWEVDARAAARRYEEQLGVKRLDEAGLSGYRPAGARACRVINPDQAEILVTNKAVEGKALKEFRGEAFAGQLQLLRMERGGVPLPLGLETTLQRMDVMYVAGLKGAVAKAAALFGRVARPSTATDLLSLAMGMVLGFLIGKISVEMAGASVGLGNAGGLLVSGVIVSSFVSRLRFFGNTPAAARNVLEDLGLIVFVAIVGVNAGATLLAQLTGAVALDIFLVGFIVCTVPPILVWAVGYHVFKVNPAVLMGGVAGARSHSGPAREAAAEVGSSVPWIGFPVGYAVSGVLLPLFGYLAMVWS